jgi:hypothetical protein
MVILRFIFWLLRPLTALASAPLRASRDVLLANVDTERETARQLRAERRVMRLEIARLRDLYQASMLHAERENEMEVKRLAAKVTR